MLAKSERVPPSARATRYAPQIFQYQLRADPLIVRDALAAVLERFAPLISSEDCGTLELVLAEVLNNIVEHGYVGTEAGLIDLSIVRDKRGLSCSVRDDGTPLPADHLIRNLETHKRPEPIDLPEGGFGWFLIRDLAEDLGYARSENSNLLAFRLPIGALVQLD